MIWSALRTCFAGCWPSTVVHQGSWNMKGHMGRARECKSSVGRLQDFSRQASLDRLCEASNNQQISPRPPGHTVHLPAQRIQSTCVPGAGLARVAAARRGSRLASFRSVRRRRAAWLHARKPLFLRFGLWIKRLSRRLRRLSTALLARTASLSQGVCSISAGRASVQSHGLGLARIVRRALSKLRELKVATWLLQELDSTLGFPGEGPPAPGTPLGGEHPTTTFVNGGALVTGPGWQHHVAGECNGGARNVSPSGRAPVTRREPRSTPRRPGKDAPSSDAGLSPPPDDAFSGTLPPFPGDSQDSAFSFGVQPDALPASQDTVLADRTRSSLCISDAAASASVFLPLEVCQPTLNLHLQGRLETVPGDGSCFFHAIKRSLLESVSIHVLRAQAECVQGWANEHHIRTLANHLKLHIVMHTVECDQVSQGIQKEWSVGVGPQDGRNVDLIHWTRNGDGIHFDVLRPTSQTGTKRGNPAESYADTELADSSLPVASRRTPGTPAARQMRTALQAAPAPPEVPELPSAFVAGQIRCFHCKERTFKKPGGLMIHLVTMHAGETIKADMLQTLRLLHRHICLQPGCGHIGKRGDRRCGGYGNAAPVRSLQEGDVVPLPLSQDPPLQHATAGPAQESQR